METRSASWSRRGLRLGLLLLGMVQLGACHASPRKDGDRCAAAARNSYAAGEARFEPGEAEYEITINAITTTCREQRWSTAAIDCMTHAAETKAEDPCRALFTDDQRSELEDAYRAYQRQQAPDPAMTAASSPAAPGDEAEGESQADLDFFTIGVMLQRIITWPEDDRPGAQALMRRAIALMDRHDLGGAARAVADEIVPDLDDGPIASMRAASRILDLHDLILEQITLDSARVYAYAGGFWITNVAWSLRQQERAAASKTFAQVDLEDLGSKATQAHADIRVAFFIDGFARRFLDDPAKALAWYDNSTLPQL
ncbi:MAG: hypothetical protein R2939_18900 [Kofleriaceae bacterium]